VKAQLCVSDQLDKFQLVVFTSELGHRDKPRFEGCTWLSDQSDKSRL
jgi:hypothetical protein